MLWSPACNHRFKVKSYYYTIQSDESSIFTWKSIWKVKAPPYIDFFTWMAALGPILTIDNLRRWGSYPCQLVLSLQKEQGETANHILIHCEFRSEIWHLVLILFGVLWSCLTISLSYFHVDVTRVGTIQRGHMESHLFFTNVEHLERKKSMSF